MAMIMEKLYHNHCKKITSSCRVGLYTFLGVLILKGHCYFHYVAMVWNIVRLKLLISATSEEFETGHVELLFAIENQWIFE